MIRLTFCERRCGLVLKAQRASIDSANADRIKNKIQRSDEMLKETNDEIVDLTTSKEPEEIEDLTKVVTLPPEEVVYTKPKSKPKAKAKPQSKPKRVQTRNNSRALKGIDMCERLLNTKAQAKKSEPMKMRGVGRTTHVSVRKTWFAILMRNELSRPKRTDKDISDRMKREFPDLKLKSFDRVSDMRRYYNRGLFGRVKLKSTAKGSVAEADAKTKAKAKATAKPKPKAKSKSKPIKKARKK